MEQIYVTNLLYVTRRIFTPIHLQNSRHRQFDVDSSGVGLENDFLDDKYFSFIKKKVKLKSLFPRKRRDRDVDNLFLFRASPVISFSHSLILKFSVFFCTTQYPEPAEVYLETHLLLGRDPNLRIDHGIIHLGLSKETTKLTSC